MALSTITGGSFARGGIVRTGDGILYAFFEISGSLHAYKHADGNASSVDSETATTIFGGGSFSGIHAGIDGDNLIHIVASCSIEQTRDVVHGTFDPSTDTFGGTWTEILDYSEGVPSTWGRSQSPQIAITANNDRHVLIVDLIKIKGVLTDTIFHTYYNGTSWSIPVRVNGADSDCSDPSISAAGTAGDEIEALYYASIYPYYRRWTSAGGWGTENSYTTQDYNWGSTGVCVDDSDNPYRAYVVDSINFDVEVNGTDTGATSHNGQPEVTIGWQGGVQYLYNVTLTGLQLWTNDGGGWSNQGIIETGGNFRWIVVNSPLNFQNDRVDLSYAGFEFNAGQVKIGRSRGGRRIITGHV